MRNGVSTLMRTACRRNSDEANGCDAFPPHRLSGQVGNAIAPVLAPSPAQANRENFRFRQTRVGESPSEKAGDSTAGTRCRRRKDSYLVDPASSHMLVSKIKPCMSKYKQSIQ